MILEGYQKGFIEIHTHNIRVAAGEKTQQIEGG